MILGIAAVDIARYYYPHARWLAWINRVAKLSVTGIAFAM
jgi:outer membrane protein assembly factor BamD (BamD/ComL family)